jgi:hypothetical protein
VSTDSFGALGSPVNNDPFGALGLPVSADLTDDDVRAAWRRIAAATHPDRADGGDPARFAAASAAYTELRTRSGRGEAHADLAEGTRSLASAHAPPARPPAPRPGTPRSGAPQSGTPRSGTPQAGAPRSGLASRIGRGRPVLLAVRLAIAAVICVVSFAVTGAQPAAFGLTAGVLTWFLLTARRDLAPPRH